MSNNGWMPIESAPKDGTRILGVINGITSKFTVEMEWNLYRGEWHRPMGTGVVIEPTHWMPLPAPPTGEDE